MKNADGRSRRRVSESGLTRSLAVSLDPHTIDMARRLGGGNASAGIRFAICYTEFFEGLARRAEVEALAAR